MTHWYMCWEHFYYGTMLSILTSPCCASVHMVQSPMSPRAMCFSVKNVSVDIMPWSLSNIVGGTGTVEKHIHTKNMHKLQYHCCTFFSVGGGCWLFEGLESHKRTHFNQVSQSWSSDPIFKVRVGNEYRHHLLRFLNKVMCVWCNIPSYLLNHKKLNWSYLAIFLCQGWLHWFALQVSHIICQ